MTLSKSHYALILPHSLMYYPQCSTCRARLQHKQKSFSFIPFQESMSYLINTHHVPGDGRELLHSRCGQAEWFCSLLTQLSRERIKGSTWLLLLSLWLIKAAVWFKAMRLIALFRHPAVFISVGHLRRYALFGVLSTVWMQLGPLVASDIWIRTEK